jgi:hypothetical protein
MSSTCRPPLLVMAVAGGGTIAMTQARRKIPVQYAKRMV